MNKEVCICAAIRYNGKIWYGHRHSHARDAMYDELSWELSRKKITKYWSSAEQGFITTRGRFVSRKVGFKLQELAGKKSKDPSQKYRALGLLFSEDLY